MTTASESKTGSKTSTSTIAAKNRVEDTTQESQLVIVFRRFLRHKLAVISAVLLGIIFVSSLLAPLITTFPRDEVDPAFGLPYNPAYYADLIEAQRFIGQGDIVSGYLGAAASFPPRIHELEIVSSSAAGSISCAAARAATCESWSLTSRSCTTIPSAAAMGRIRLVTKRWIPWPTS